MEEYSLKSSDAVKKRTRVSLCSLAGYKDIGDQMENVNSLNATVNS